MPVLTRERVCVPIVPAGLLSSTPLDERGEPESKVFGIIRLIERITSLLYFTLLCFALLVFTLLYFTLYCTLHFTVHYTLLYITLQQESGAIKIRLASET